MGNCLVLQEKVIKIMKMDGKFLEYQPPLQVHQVLSEFSGHAISDTLSVVRRLRPDTKMRTGRTYYLLPPPLLPSTEVAKRMSILSNTIKEAADGTGVVRIKIVITKQELKEMLRKGGVLVDKMVPQLQSKDSFDDCDGDGDGDDNGSCIGWKPVLESIPELN